jgi:hypothetical protein
LIEICPPGQFRFMSCSVCIRWGGGRSGQG